MSNDLIFPAKTCGENNLTSICCCYIAEILRNIRGLYKLGNSLNFALWNRLNHSTLKIDGQVKNIIPVHSVLEYICFNNSNDYIFD